MPLAFLLDIEGTLYTESGPVPGAADAIGQLRAQRIPFRFVTNTTQRPRAAVVERLRHHGFDAEAGDVFTAVLAGAEVARSRGHHAVAPFVAEATLPDLGEFELMGGLARAAVPGNRPDAVIVGDLGDRWSFDLMLEAFRYLMAGAELIALSKDRYWRRGDGLALDAGAFVVGLEYASGATATVAGKPSPSFFAAAARSLGLPAETPGEAIAMVGDDLWSDVDGARRAGYQGWLVRTGKFREDALETSGVRPDRVLESVADLAGSSP